MTSITTESFNSTLTSQKEHLLSLLIENGFNFIYEHFSEQIRLVQLAKEESVYELEQSHEPKIRKLKQVNRKQKKIAYVEESCTSLMQQLDEYKAKSLENCNKMNETFERANKLVNRVDTYFQTCTLTNPDEELELLNQVQKEIVQVKSQMFDNKLIQFDKADPAELKHSLGSIYFETFDSKITKLIAGTQTGEIIIYNLETRESINTFKPHDNCVWCVRLLTQNRIATSSSDGTVKILNLTSGFCLATLGVPGYAMIRQIEQWDSNHLVCCAEFFIKIWNLETKECVTTIQSETNYGIRILSNDRLLNSFMRGTKIYDLNTGQLLKSYEIKCCIDYLPAPVELIFNGVRTKGTKNGCVLRKFDMATETFQLMSASYQDCHRLGISCIKVLPDSNRIATGSYDHNIKIWDLSANECIQTLIGHSDHVCVLTTISDNILVSCDSLTIKFWDLETYTCIETVNKEGSSYTSIYCI